jgi:hypothetical protein
VDIAAEDDDCNDYADNAIDEVKPPSMSSRSYRLDHNIADEEPSTSRNHLPGRKTADTKPGRKSVTFDGGHIVDDELSSGNDAQDCGDHDRDSCEDVSSENKHLASHNPASTSSSSSSSSYLHAQTHSSSLALINTKQPTNSDLSESALLVNPTTNPSSNAIARQQTSNHRALLAPIAHTTPSCQTASASNNQTELEVDSTIASSCTSSEAGVCKNVVPVVLHSKNEPSGSRAISVDDRQGKVLKEGSSVMSVSLNNSGAWNHAGSSSASFARPVSAKPESASPASVASSSHQNCHDSVTKQDKGSNSNSSNSACVTRNVAWHGRTVDLGAQEFSSSQVKMEGKNRNTVSHQGKAELHRGMADDNRQQGSMETGANRRVVPVAVVSVHDVKQEFVPAPWLSNMKNNKTSNQHHRQSYAQVPPNRLSQQNQLGGAAALSKTSHKNAPVSISTSLKLPNFLVRKKERDFEPKGEFFYDPSAARERISLKEGDEGVTVLDSSDEDERESEGKMGEDESGEKMGESGVNGKGSGSVIVLSDSD